MGKLTINLCEELHQKIREDVAADESLTTSLLMERIIREHYEGPKPRPRIESGGRTMAFSVSEELFHQIKAYLAAHKKLSQKEFMVSLVENAVSAWEAGAEADGSPIVEVLPELTEEEKRRRSFNPLSGEYTHP